MSVSGPEPEDPVAWARRVNGRWIVHHGLRDDAVAYMDSLAAADTQRLRQCCARSWRLVHECPPGEDPKPWFYAGLFSLATPDEARRFLASHDFTTACLPSLAKAADLGSLPDNVAPQTQEKLEHIRKALGRLG